MKIQNKRIPSEGDKVIGRHMFGRLFVGTILSARWDTVNSSNPFRIVFVKFDAPRNLSVGKDFDVRTEICMTLSPSKNVEGCWVEEDGGGWIEFD